MLERWTSAGVLDAAGAERIRAFEATREQAPHLRWPMLLASGFGALLLGAGVLLFVSSHWDALSPATRFLLVLGLVALFHVAGALTGDDYRTLRASLHAVGTVALGAGVLLAGQIFNMAEHWPGGVLLWAVGAWGGWLLLRHDAQLFFAALLTPAWCVSEWLAVLQRHPRSVFEEDPITPVGVVLLALAYFTVSRTSDGRRNVLVWLGGIALVPGLIYLAIISATSIRLPPVSQPLQILAWSVAFGAPLVFAVMTRRQSAWMNAVAALWVATLLWFSTFREPLLLHGWWALGALGLTGWGVSERRTERINVGAGAFGITVIVFYFSTVMDKLGRSASLIGFGLLFLAGGWALERGRRQLVRAARGGVS
jgi:MFS family permease